MLRKTFGPARQNQSEVDLGGIRHRAVYSESRKNHEGRLSVRGKQLLHETDDSATHPAATDPHKRLGQTTPLEGCHKPVHVAGDDTLA